MPNSYYGDRLKMLKPERLDIFSVPYGDFITVTGSGIGCTFGDKVRNLYVSNLFLSGHHQGATGFLAYGSGDASPHGSYRGAFLPTSGNPEEYYYYNNKLYYTGDFSAFRDGTLKFKTQFSDKHILMSNMTSGAVTYIESTIFTGDGTATGFHLHPSWVQYKAPYNENYLLVNISKVPMDGFPSGIGRQLDPIQDYIIPETGNGYVLIDGAYHTPLINFHFPPPAGWRISVRNLMVC